MQQVSDDAFNTIMQDYHLPQNATLAVAVSGGADSMCLLHLLKTWCDASSHPLVALTVNHNLRKEAEKEAERVASWCKALDVPHETLTWQGTKPTSNIQEQAREIRYGMLGEYCKEHGIHHLCVAHHQQDQAETVLIRALRGSGVKGLAAMQGESKRGELILLRPLLSFLPQVIRNTLQVKQQEWIEDPSNQDRRYLRVAVRQFLEGLSGHEERVHHLCRVASQASHAESYIQQALAQEKERCWHIHPEGYITLDIEVFRALHAYARHMLLIEALMVVSGNHDAPRIEDIEHLDSQLQQAELKGVTLHGCFLRGGRRKSDMNVLYVMRELNAVAADMPVTKQACFDGRFMCVYEGKLNKDYTVGVLGQEGWLSIKDKVVPGKIHLPTEVIYTLPVLKALEKVISAPHLGYYEGAESQCFKIELEK